MPRDLEIEIKAEFVKLLVNKETMELTERETMLADALYEAVYGESLEQRDAKLLQQNEIERLAEKTMIARRLLRLGALTTKQVAETTDLPITAVQSIQKELNREQGQ